jgi:hypothetical protein
MELGGMEALLACGLADTDPACQRERFTFARASSGYGASSFSWVDLPWFTLLQFIA